MATNLAILAKLAELSAMLTSLRNYILRHQAEFLAVKTRGLTRFLLSAEPGKFL